MKRAIYSTALFAAVLVALPAFAADLTVSDTTKLNADADKALQSLYTESEGSKTIVESAKGVLIFPEVTKAGLGVGGEYGQGVLRMEGKNVGYYSTKSLSVGLQAGAQTKSMVLVFLSEDALKKFRESNGWEAGVDGNVAVLKVGAGTKLDTTTMKDPIIGFVFGNKGLMADISFKGAKFSKLDIS